MLVDAHWSLPLDRLEQVSHRLVFYSWDPGKLGRYFHYSGNLLESVSHSALTLTLIRTLTRTRTLTLTLTLTQP